MIYQLERECERNTCEIVYNFTNLYRVPCLFLFAMSQQGNNGNNANSGNNDNTSNTTVTPEMFNNMFNTLNTTLTEVMNRLAAVEARPSGSNTTGGRGNPRRDEAPADDREVHHPNPNPIPNVNNPLFNENDSPRGERYGRNTGFVNAQGQGRGEYESENSCDEHEERANDNDQNLNLLAYDDDDCVEYEHGESLIVRRVLSVVPSL